MTAQETLHFLGLNLLVVQWFKIHLSMQGKISHAPGQLSPCASTIVAQGLAYLEPVLCNE